MQHYCERKSNKCEVEEIWDLQHWFGHAERKEEEAWVKYDKLEGTVLIKKRKIYKMRFWQGAYKLEDFKHVTHYHQALHAATG